MRYVVAYDIEADRVRVRVAKTLGTVGVRVQKSVFECSLDGRELAWLTRRLERELLRSGGDVRIYRTCAGCLGASLGVGDLAEGLATDPWVIV